MKNAEKVKTKAHMNLVCEVWGQTVVEIDIFWLIYGIMIGVFTPLIILYTRRIARRIQEKAEKRRRLEQEKEDLRLEVENLRSLLREKEKEIARLETEKKERGEKDKERERRLDSITESLDSLREKLEKIEISEKEE